MSKPFDYPPNGWISYSKRDVATLATHIHRAATGLGADWKLLGASYPTVVGWNKCIQSSGFNLEFIETDYGCEIHVYVFNEDDNAVRFLVLWMWYVDKGYIWGGPYKQQLVSKTNAIEDPFKQFALEICEGRHKLREKMKFLFLTAVQSQNPKEAITLTIFRNYLLSWNARKVDEVLQTGDHFRRFVKEFWSAEILYSDEATLYGRVTGMSPERLSGFYSQEEVKSVLMKL